MSRSKQKQEARAADRGDDQGDQAGRDPAHQQALAHMERVRDLNASTVEVVEEAIALQLVPAEETRRLERLQSEIWRTLMGYVNSATKQLARQKQHQREVAARAWERDHPGEALVQPDEDEPSQAVAETP